MSSLSAFLAGEHPEAVAIYLAEGALRNAEAIADRAETVEGGYVLVLSGEHGREVFSVVSGEPPMEFAQEASRREGTVDRDLTGGDCPDDDANEADDGGERETASHDARFVLAFVQEQTEDAGGLYEEGDVVHAYVSCDCGVAYSDRWLVGDESDA